MDVIVAGPEHAEEVARLFDGYRMFYRQPSDPDGCRAFIAERLANGDSHILCAVHDGRLVGFTQLYPSFTSVGMQRIWVLNDLFVDPDARRLGVGRTLLRAACEHGRATGAVRLTLETEVSNTRAQALYEDEGWEKGEGFYVYTIGLESAG